jgi:hypothetical protein
MNTVTCPSPVVTSTVVGETENEVSVGRVSARAGPAAATDAAAATVATTSGSRSRRRAEVDLSLAKLGMREVPPGRHRRGAAPGEHCRRL